MMWLMLLGMLFCCAILDFRTTLDASLSMCPSGAEGPFGTCLCISGFTGFNCSQRVCPSAKAWADFPTTNNIAHAPYTECSNMVGWLILSAPFLIIRVIWELVSSRMIWRCLSSYCLYLLTMMAFYRLYLIDNIIIFSLDRVHVTEKRVFVFAGLGSRDQRVKHVRQNLKYSQKNLDRTYDGIDLFLFLLYVPLLFTCNF